MDRELIWQASTWQREAQETEQEVGIVEKELNELVRFNENLKWIADSYKKTMLASLGKGILIKTEVQDKKLFVNVGAGVIVKKSPEEVQKIVEAQIIRLGEVRGQLLARIEFLGRKLQEAIVKIEKSQSEK